jgi:hypothetical protein
MSLGDRQKVHLYPVELGPDKDGDYYGGCGADIGKRAHNRERWQWMVRLYATDLPMLNGRLCKTCVENMIRWGEIPVNIAEQLPRWGKPYD